MEKRLIVNVGRELGSGGRQMAKLRQQIDEDVYARQMYCLGIFYNTALLAVEANFSTYPIKELQRLGYPRQYVRQTEDSFTHKLRQSYGFRTSSITRVEWVRTSR